MSPGGGEEYLHGSFNDFISSVSIHERISRVFFIISFRGRRLLLCALKEAEAAVKIRRKEGPKTLLRERDYPRSRFRVVARQFHLALVQHA